MSLIPQQNSDLVVYGQPTGPMQPASWPFIEFGDAASGTHVMDASQSSYFFFSLNGNISVDVANMSDPSSITMCFAQDGYGTHTVAFPGSWLLGTPAPAVDTTPYADSTLRLTLVNGTYTLVALPGLGPQYNVAQMIAFTGKNPANFVDVMGFVPKQYHASIIAGSSLDDLSQYLNEATLAAGPEGGVVFPQRDIRGRQVQLWYGQSWVGYQLRLPPNVADALVVDQFWGANVTTASAYQNVQMHLMGSTLANTRFPGRSSITGSVDAGGVLTVSFVNSNVSTQVVVRLNQYLQATGIAPGVTVVSQLTSAEPGGQLGRTGTYQLSAAPGAPVAAQWMATSDFYPGGASSVGYLCLSQRAWLRGFVQGFGTGLALTSYTQNGSTINVGNTNSLYLRQGTRFVTCDAAIKGVADSKSTDNDLDGVVFANCGTYAQPVIDIKMSGWDFRGGKMFSNVGQLINAGGTRNFSMQGLNIQLNGGGYQDPALPAREWRMIEVDFDPASYGTLRFSGEMRFDAAASQHSYRLYRLDTARINDSRVTFDVAFESELVPGSFSGYDVQCIYATDPTNLFGTSGCTFRADYTLGQRGNGWFALQAPPALIAQTGAMASTAASTYVDPFVAAAGPRCYGGRGIGRTRYDLYDAMLAGVADVLPTLDVLLVAAAPDQVTANTNTVYPAAYKLVPVGSPSFVADRGYTGNGASAYLDVLGADPTKLNNFLLGSACLFVWCGGPDISANGDYAVGTTLGGRSRINPKQTSATASMRLQSTTSYTCTSTSGLGSFGAVRRLSGVPLSLYVDGAVGATPATIEPLFLGAGDFLLLCDGLTSFSNRNVLAVAIGGPLTDDQANRLAGPSGVGAVSTFLHAIGAL